jgi:hypothetical protein
LPELLRHLVVLVVALNYSSAYYWRLLEQQDKGLRVAEHWRLLHLGRVAVVVGASADRWIWFYCWPNGRRWWSWY